MCPLSMLNPNTHESGDAKKGSSKSKFNLHLIYVRCAHETFSCVRLTTFFLLVPGTNTAGQRRSRRTHERPTEVWLDQGRAHAMSPEHLGCHVVPAFELGRRTGR